MHKGLWIIFGLLALLFIVLLACAITSRPSPAPQPEPEPEPIPEPEPEPPKPHVHAIEERHNSTIVRKYTYHGVIVSMCGDITVVVPYTDYYLELADGYKLRVGYSTYKNAQEGDTVHLWRVQEDILWWHRWRNHGQIIRNGTIIDEW